MNKKRERNDSIKYRKPEYKSIFQVLENDFLGKRVRVRLWNDEEISGFLTSIDLKNLNVILENPRSSTKKPMLSTIFIKGGGLKLMEVLA